MTRPVTPEEARGMLDAVARAGWDAGARSAAEHLDAMMRLRDSAAALAETVASEPERIAAAVAAEADRIYRAATAALADYLAADDALLDAIGRGQVRDEYDPLIAARLRTAGVPARPARAGGDAVSRRYTAAEAQALLDAARLDDRLRPSGAEDALRDAAPDLVSSLAATERDAALAHAEELLGALATLRAECDRLTRAAWAQTVRGDGAEAEAVRLTRERDALRAIIAGRTTPPTDAETDKRTTQAQKKPADKPVARAPEKADADRLGLAQRHDALIAKIDAVATQPDAVKLWRAERATVAQLREEIRAEVWDRLCVRVAKIGKMGAGEDGRKVAHAWLRKALAEESARDEAAKAQGAAS